MLECKQDVAGEVLYIRYWWPQTKAAMQEKQQKEVKAAMQEKKQKGVKAAMQEKKQKGVKPAMQEKQGSLNHKQVRLKEIYSERDTAKRLLPKQLIPVAPTS